MVTKQDEFFAKATLDICRNLEVHKAMEVCFDYLKVCVPLDSMYLQVYENDLGSMRIIAKAIEDSSQSMDTLIAIPEEVRKDFEVNLDRFRLNTDQRIALINDPGAHSLSRTLLSALKEPTSSTLILMLMIDDAPLGALVCVAHGIGHYTDEHRPILELLYEPFLIALSNALAHREVQRLRNILIDDNRYLQQELDHISGDNIIGAEFGLKKTMTMVRQVARHESPVLITGETGTGKDLLATAIHRSSPRYEQPFIRVNCGAIPESLVDSELFGHEKGAFTGAVTQERGRFERANGGTIFLDEIGELPFAAQVRLLRVLQNQEIERVGGTETIAVDIRVVAATNRDLPEMVAAGTFREDLWFRISVFPIEIPPLRMRRPDIPALVHHFLTKKCKELKLPVQPILEDLAIDDLMNYRWPGNVRELENIVERALILHDSGPLSFRGVLSISRTACPDPSDEPDNQELDAVLANHIRRILAETKGKIHGPGGAAEILGVNPSTLRNKISKLGIVVDR